MTSSCQASICLYEILCAAHSSSRAGAQRTGHKAGQISGASGGGSGQAAGRADAYRALLGVLRNTACRNINTILLRASTLEECPPCSHVSKSRLFLAIAYVASRRKAFYFLRAEWFVAPGCHDNCSQEKLLCFLGENLDPPPCRLRGAGTVHPILHHASLLNLRTNVNVSRPSRCGASSTRSLEGER